MHEKALNSRFRWPRLFTTILVLAALLAALTASIAAAPPNDTSPDGIWQDVPEPAIPAGEDRPIVPDRYRTVGLDREALLQALDRAPLEFTEAARANPLIMSLPLPDGGFQRFRVVESPIMAPELAAKFPDIRTYAAQGVDDPTAAARLDWTPAGFHGMILSVAGTVYIDPYSRNTTAVYISYYAHDLRPTSPFQEVLPTTPEDKQMADEIAQLVASGKRVPSGEELRTYRLALAATGEYTQYHGGTVPLGMAAIVTAVNRVTGVYEQDMAVRMVLIANNDLLVYTNPATDPYTNNNGSLMLGQNQANIDAVIGDANYDIGHVFSTGGGGIASLGVPCRTGAKARGVTGGPNPIGDPFYIDYVAHEMGHQYGANHTFNGNEGSCAGNRAGATAFEPGSGSTIMAYAGICGSQDLQPNSDDHFHGASYDEIIAYTTLGAGNTCPVITLTGNAPPVPDAGTGGFTIPAQTPFTLTGSATDPDGHPLTYNWEEFDLGPAGPPDNPLSPPFFRSWPSLPEPSRTFPRPSDLVNNTTAIGEVLPNVSRVLNFRMTVRDNQIGGGGVDFDTVNFNVTTDAGPFRVTAPNTAVTWTALTTDSVTWNVANTAAAPASCALVDILLSTDGGFTYPVVLAAGEANDGSATVGVPNMPSTTARVKVACASNIFFDISNVNFTLQAPTTPDFTLVASPDAVAVRAPEEATYNVALGSILGFSSPVNLSASGAPAGATVSFSPNPASPPTNSTLTVGNTAAASPGQYTLDITGTSGPLTHSDQVQLDLSTALPGQPTPFMPVNGALNQPLRPTFTWAAASQGVIYDIQIATDPAFSNVVASASGLTDTTFTPADNLSTGTTYFWRVQAHNACGTGNYSLTYRFSTQAAVGACGPGTTANVLLSDDFETGAPGWTTGGVASTWALGAGISPGGPHSGSNVYHGVDSPNISDQYLVSPAIALPTGQSPLSVQFWNYQELEDSGPAGCYDGGVIEISDDGGATWTRLETELLTDPYDGPVDTRYGNPLGGQNAWCGDPQNWLNSIVDLDAFAGETVQFRWRLGTDNAVGHPGWDVDDVLVQACQAAPTCFWADIDCSCGVSSTTIDALDVAAAASAWLTYHGAGLLTPAADVDCRASGGCDGVNDILDVMAVASMWGAACP